MNNIMSYTLVNNILSNSLIGLYSVLDSILTIIKIIILIKIFLIILGFIAKFVIFEKAGEKGWKCLIPIYSTYTKYKISKIEKLFWLEISILMFEIAFSLLGFGVVALIFSLIAYILESIILPVNLGEVFKKGILFKLGLILFPELFEIILAFGSSKYIEKDNKYDFYEI